VRAASSASLVPGPDIVCSAIFPSRGLIIDSAGTRAPPGYARDSPEHRAVALDDAVLQRVRRLAGVDVIRQLGHPLPSPLRSVRGRPGRVFRSTTRARASSA
jgi:hypothetical protein